MKSKLFTIFIFTLISVGTVSSQAIFAEKFEGCITDEFSLESDTTTAKIQNAELIKVITSGLTEKLRGKINGKLTLQIIVDLQGNSCLISVKNDTNIKTAKLGLKKNVDSNLFWEKPKKKVAAIVLLNFNREEIKLKRLGMNSKRGVHELIN